MVKQAGLKPGVYEVSEEIEAMVAKTKLNSMEMYVDELTDKQKQYLASWEEGT